MTMQILHDNRIFTSQDALFGYLEKLMERNRLRSALDLIRALDQHRLLSRCGLSTWVDAYDVADKYDRYGKVSDRGD